MLIAITMVHTNGYEDRGGYFFIGIWAAFIVAAVGGIVWITRTERSELLVGRLSYRSVFALAVLVAGFYWVGTFWLVPDERFFNVDYGHKFSFVLPGSMQEDVQFRRPLGEKTHIFDDTRLIFSTHQKLPFLIVAAITHRQFRAPGDPMPSLNKIVAGRGFAPMAANFSPTGKDDWQVATIDAHNSASGREVKFIAYKRVVNTDTLGTDLDWYVICAGPPARFENTKAICQTPLSSFAATWRQTPSRSGGQLVTWLDAVQLADLDPATRFELTCRRCDKIRFVTAAELLAREDFGRLGDQGQGLVLRETIWARPSYLSPLALFSGEDLEIENLALFLSGKKIETRQTRRRGWMFKEPPATAKRLAESMR